MLNSLKFFTEAVEKGNRKGKYSECGNCNVRCMVLSKRERDHIVHSVFFVDSKCDCNININIIMSERIIIPSEKRKLTCFFFFFGSYK